MKVIIAGSRDFHDLGAVSMATLDYMSATGNKITEVVSGKAKGVDKLGERWAEEMGIPVKPFYADWLKYPKAAGPIRNRQMAHYADALIALWNGDKEGSGTWNMIQEMTKLGKYVWVHEIPK